MKINYELQLKYNSKSISIKQETEIGYSKFQKKKTKLLFLPFSNISTGLRRNNG